MTVYGYARVSTTAGVEQIFSEKVSGVVTKRPQMELLFDQLEAGDVPVVTKLDRLARLTLGLLRIIDLIGTALASNRSVIVGPTLRLRMAA